MLRSNLSASFHHLEIWTHIITFISKSVNSCNFNFSKPINVRIFNDFCQSFLVITFSLFWANFLLLLRNIKQFVLFALLFKLWNNIDMFCDIPWKLFKFWIILHKSLHILNWFYFCLTWTFLFEFLHKLIQIISQLAIVQKHICFKEFILIWINYYFIFHSWQFHSMILNANKLVDHCLIVPLI